MKAVRNRVWKNIIKKYNFSCAHCGMPDKMTKDHIVPKSLGGSNSLNNIQPLCRRCNKEKGNNTQKTNDDLFKRDVIGILFKEN